MRARLLLLVPLLSFVAVFAGTLAYYELEDGDAAAETGRRPANALPTETLFAALEEEPTVRVHRVELDGTAGDPLTAGTEPNDGSVLVEAHPDWSPVAERLAMTRYLVRGGDAEPPKIWTLAADGSQLVQLTDGTHPDFLPAWSPDGTRIAFTRELRGSAEIFVMNADGSGVTQLTHDRAVNDDHPAWSPDGAQIVYASGTESGQDLYVMSADGSDPTRVTSGPFFASEPSWSPDGDEIAFICDSDPCLVGAKPGSRAVQLLGTRPKEFSPRWSPDGRWIAFARFPGGLRLLEVATRKEVPVALQADSFTLSWGPA
jgi:dipeptidyl aminopeptidase/acylaminoacyl peptidase